MTDWSLRLDEERRRAVAQIAARAAEYRAVAAAAMTEGRDDEHDPDGSTPAAEHALAFALLAAAQAHLAEVDGARQRLAAGDYGRCERCGAQIAPARLDAVLTARTCVSCPGPSPTRRV